MAFNSTPRALLSKNSTPLDIGELDTYAALSSENLLDIQTTPDDRHIRKYFVAAGCRIDQILPHHISNQFSTAVGDPAKILEILFKQADEAANELNGLLLNLPGNPRFEIKPPRAGEIDDYGFSRKSKKKIRTKADKDYNGDQRRVVDIVRTTLLAYSAEDIQKISEALRPCAMPNVVRFQNEFAQPNMQHGTRRLLINFRAANGHVAEIQVFHKAAKDIYDASRQKYSEQQAAEDAKNRAGWITTGWQALVSADIFRQKAEKERLAANEAAARLPDVSILQTRQEFFLIDDFPVMLVHDNWEKQRFTVVPNPLSGLWETDQRFLEILDNRDGDADIKEITRDEAAQRAIALSRTEEIKTLLSHNADLGLH